MTQPIAVPDGTDETPAGGTTALPAESKTDISTLPVDIQDYIRGLRKEAEDTRKEKKRIETAAQQQERERLEKDKEWETLAVKYKTDLDASAPRVERLDAMEQFLRDSAAARIKALPKQYQSLVPDYDDPLKTLAWLDANAATLSLPKPPDIGAGQQGDNGKKPIELTPEQKQMAKNLKMSEEKYAAELRKEPPKRS